MISAQRSTEKSECVFMVDNPMFYRKITALNRETHKNVKVDLGAVRFGFARGTHMIPAVIDEFFAGGRTLPIVFLPGPLRATPVFLVGFEPNENLFVGAEGKWTGDYIPAFIRRYPFIIGEVDGGQQLVCIDEAASTLSADRGERLFLDSGEEAPLLREIAKFTTDYLAAANRTNDFIDILQRLELFTGITIAVRVSGGDNKTLHGAMSIDATKFDALSDQTFLELRSKGFLQPIFSQISSIALIEKLAAKSKPTETLLSATTIGNLPEMQRDEADLLN